MIVQETVKEAARKTLREAVKWMASQAERMAGSTANNGCDTRMVGLEGKMVLGLE